MASCASDRAKRAENKPTFPSRPALSNIDVSAYAQPFGHSVISADLTKIFLSLPDALAADMPVEMRKRYIEEYGPKSSAFLFDPRHKFATYYNDNPYNPVQPSARFYVKILPSIRYRYIVVIHIIKPSTSDSPNPPAPSAANTFFLAPFKSQWIDVTDQVLPPPVHRDWYFQPLRESSHIQTGPYEQKPSGDWREGHRIYDLVWKRDHFVNRPPSSDKFSSAVF